MGIEQLSTERIAEILAVHEQRHPLLGELESDARRRLAWMAECPEEIVGIEHLARVLADGISHRGDAIIRCYVGYEPSGQAHIGWLAQSLTLRRVLEAGGNVLVFLADWHAWINDKFDGDMQRIQRTAAYMEEVFRALLDHPEEGEGAGQLRFVHASTLMDSGDYWMRVLRCSKNMSLARVRRTFGIMGRDEDSSERDLSRFFYPAMQAADIFELQIDIAIGGMDQRKAHMYMREVGDHHGWTKAACFHTPIISSLKASGERMEAFDHKMSKSQPSSAILLHDTPERLRKKLRKAFLDPESSDSPVYELVEHIILPVHGSITVTPKPEFGEPSTYASLGGFIAAVKDESVHPLDAKFAVADAISSLLAPVHAHFEANPSTLEEVISFSN